MINEAAQNDTNLATALLDIIPKLLRRLRADVPLDDDACHDSPGWRKVAELRATPGQLTLLGILVEHDHCTMQELAEHLVVAPSTATAMVKRLLTQGYIERSRDNTDWRTVWVKPTEAGRLAVAVSHRAWLLSLQRRLEHLSDDERAGILAAIPALYHLIEV